MIQTTASSVGGVVDVGRIESLPLNGRQFANLAATIPGVGLGFHTDPTKSTQFSPQIAGGNGRNVNYQIDGGDNNDDTVGGLLQLFPLEAIQEFNFVTPRYKAEYGRSNGGVMNIVTKSGTNDLRGSWLHAVPRHDAMNAQERRPRSCSRRGQAGLSPLPVSAARSAVRSCRQGALLRAPSSARSRTRSRSVDTQGLFPALDGVYSDARTARTCSPARRPTQRDADAVPVGALRP